MQGPRYRFREAAELIRNLLTCTGIPLVVRETLGAWRMEQLLQMVGDNFPDEKELLEAGLLCCGFVSSHTADGTIVKPASFNPASSPNMREHHFIDLVSILDVFRDIREESTNKFLGEENHKTVLASTCVPGNAHE